MSEVTIVEGNHSPENAVKLRNRFFGSKTTHDLKNGSPKLQLNNAPKEGSSVDTMLLAMHVVASPALFCATKSRGSMGNCFPPNSKERVCAVEQGYVGSALGFAANAGDTLLRIEVTTSLGPRRMLLPYHQTVRGRQAIEEHAYRRTVSMRAEIRPPLLAEAGFASL